jgi:type IV secretory pathway VirB2 component (pilin)
MIRMPFSRVRRTIATLAAVAFVILIARARRPCSGSSMPWEAPLQSILQSIEGPVAKIIAVIIIIVTGLTLAFGDTSGGFRR